MNQKGIFEFEIDGVKVGFKFGTYALSVACEKEGCSLSELFRKIGFNNTGDVNLKALLNLWYGAAVHYYHHFDKDVDFNTSMVSDWLDDIGIEQVRETYYNGLQQFVPKNSPAPKKAGRKREKATSR